MRVPLFAVDKLSREVRSESLAALERAFDNGQYILGPEVAAFEAAMSERFGNECHCVAVSNGTDALVCALASLGVTRGHRVLTTPLTFFATVSAILRVGATPVFCDVDERTFNIDVTTCDPALAPNAVLPVHLFGRAVDVARIRGHLPGVPVIEDAAQALGAVCAAIQVGAMGELAAFSFFPTKPLGGCGDGGLVVTRDPTLAERCRAIRSHGRTSEGTFELVGGNYRLDALQAALLRVRLGHVDDWQHRRRANAEFYRQHLAECTGVFLPPTDEATNVSAWSVFAVRVPERRHALRQFLAARGIETAVYYPTAAHLQPALGQNRGRPGQYPIAERLTRELLALPVGPELAPEQRDYVVESVTRFFSNHSAVAPQ